MTAEVSFRYIFFSENGNLVVPGDDLLAVRIVNRTVLAPAVAGIAHSEMRSHFLCNQNRQLIADAIFLRHSVSRGIRTDGKLTDGKALVAVHDRLFQILEVLLLRVKVGTVILCHHTIPEYHPEILIVKACQEGLGHFQHTIGSRKLR